MHTVPRISGIDDCIVVMMMIIIIDIGSVVWNSAVECGASGRRWE